VLGLFFLLLQKNGLSLEVGNSLVRASVSVVNCETSQRGQTILVGSLFNVTSLELDGFSAMVCLCYYITPSFMFV
jgi:hypothetical protein